MKRKLPNWRLCAAVFIFLAFFSVFPNYVFAGNSQITGTVRDSVSGEPLPFASVAIAGTNQGAFTDKDGAFRLINLDAGSYTLSVSYVGYTSRTMGVSIAKGEIKKIVILLTSTTVLREVVVSTQRRGQAAAINQQLNSDAVVNIVSADRIRELPDVNAAEALGRLPGVSLERSGGEGSKVVLRGLDPKLSNISLNGVKLPSTSGTDRSVDMSVISPELLSGVEVFKSPTADMDADAVGGTVNLVIKKAPDELRNVIRVYGGYSNLKQSFQNYKGSWEFSSRFLNKKLGAMAQVNYERANRSSQGLQTGLDAPDQNRWDSVYIVSNNFKDNSADKKRYGGSLFLDYQFDKGGVYLTSFYSESPTNSYLQSKQITTAGGMNYTAQPKESKTNVWNSSIGGDWNFNWIKLDWSASRSKVNVFNSYDLKNEFSIQAPKALVPEARYNTTLRDPFFLFNNQNLAATRDSVFLDKITWAPDSTNQTNYIVKLDLEVPYKLGNKISGFIKFGGKYTSEKRKRHVSQLSSISYGNGTLTAIADEKEGNTLIRTGANGSLISMLNFSDPNASVDLFDGYALSPMVPEGRVRDWWKHHGGPGSNEFTTNMNNVTDNYDSWETVSAGYIMAKLNYKELITFVPGVRYEYADNVYHGIYSNVTGLLGDNGTYWPDTSTQSYGEILPSAHLKIKPAKWFDVRASVAKTLSRPSYAWVIPAFHNDANNGKISRSNPELKHSIAWNYDAAVSVYTNDVGLLSIGGFIKNIDNMFVSVEGGILSAEKANAYGLEAKPYSLSGDYVNLDNSWVKGIEFEAQTHFGFLPAPFDRFVLNVNMSRMWSETSYYKWNQQEGTYYVYHDNFQFQRPAIGISEKSHFEVLKAKLPTQVTFICNAALGYDYKKFSGRVSMSYQDAYVSKPDAYRRYGKDEYSDTYLRFDASFKYKVNKFVSVLMNLQNITNAYERTYLHTSGNELDKLVYGATAELGLQISLH